jgi:hypothetical protein
MLDAKSLCPFHMHNLLVNEWCEMHITTAHMFFIYMLNFDDSYVHFDCCCENSYISVPSCLLAWRERIICRQRTRVALPAHRG